MPMHLFIIPFSNSIIHVLFEAETQGEHPSVMMFTSLEIIFSITL